MLKKIRELLKKFVEEKGQGVVEYALILGFVAVIAVAIISSSGLKDSTVQNVNNEKKVLDAVNYQFSSAGGSDLSTAAPTTDPT